MNLKKEAGQSWKDAKASLRARIHAKFRGCCAYCGAEVTAKEMQMDHVVPKAAGGTDEESNLFPACVRCNRWKAVYSVEEFRREISLQVERLEKNSPGYNLARDFDLIGEGITSVVTFFFELERDFIEEFGEDEDERVSAVPEKENV